VALLVDDVEDAFQRLARRFGLGPAGQGLGHRVQEGDAAVGVGGDDRVADAREGVTKPIALFVRGALDPPRLGRMPAWFRLAWPLRWCYRCRLDADRLTGLGDVQGPLPAA